ncbi:MAG: hypothetical protein ACI8W8_004692 [Rhodothermales bacterium]|jgi:hypothetical protein
MIDATHSDNLFLYPWGALLHTRDKHSTVIDFASGEWREIAPTRFVARDSETVIYWEERKTPDLRHFQLERLNLRTQDCEVLLAEGVVPPQGYSDFRSRPDIAVSSDARFIAYQADGKALLRDRADDSIRVIAEDVSVWNWLPDDLHLRCWRDGQRMLYHRETGARLALPALPNPSPRASLSGMLEASLPQGSGSLHVARYGAAALRRFAVPQDTWLDWTWCTDTMIALLTGNRLLGLDVETGATRQLFPELPHGD